MTIWPRFCWLSWIWPLMWLLAPGPLCETRPIVTGFAFGARARTEADFVDSGFGIERFDLMYNDFVIVGPKQDPAQIAGLSDPVLALQRIAAAGGPFSRAEMIPAPI